MASSSRKSARRRRKTFFGEGDPPISSEAAMPRSGEDDGGSSSPGSEPMRAVDEVLGQPTVDPWYKSSDRFPSMPVNPQPPPAEWEWLVVCEDAAADIAWVSTFREIRDLQIQRKEILAILLSFDFHCSRATGWLPVFSPGRLQFTAYCVHRVRRQFGFDQEIPAVMGVAVGKIPTINLFLKARAFAYWSSVTSRVVIPSGNRVGIYTTAMSNYWRDFEFRNNRRGDISHLLQARVSPLPHPCLFAATNTLTTYANRQSSGYVVWR